MAVLCASIVAGAAPLAVAAQGEPTGSAPPRPAPAVRIAVVDAQLILQKAQAAQSIQKQLEAQREELTKIVAAQEESLKLAEQELARSRLGLKPEEFDARRRDLEVRVSESRRMVQERTRRLDIAFNEAREKLLRTINQVVSDIARERGATLVIRRDTILYMADADQDISQIVLDRLNVALPQVTVNIPK